MEIDDSIRTLPLALPDDKKQMACCPKDGEPLICTLEFNGAEFICMVCGKLYGWLAPVGKPVTSELHSRYLELQAQYNIEREKRKRDSNGTL